MFKESSFYYKDETLYAEGVSIKDIVAELGTPLYIYSQKSFENQLYKLQTAFSKYSAIICYSLKVNHNINVIKYFSDSGCGMDIVSGGELFRAKKAGVDLRKVVYSGVAKTKHEIVEALENNILMLNVESEQELLRINQIAGEMDKIAPVAIRVNPAVDAKTHPHITTGMKENKFGIDHEFIMDIFKLASNLQNIDLIGIDCHIGSQILELSSYKEAMKVISKYVSQLKNEGIFLKYIDVGGGLGVSYCDGQSEIDVQEYADTIYNSFKDLGDFTFIIEPGRFLVAQAGILVTEVQYVKQNIAGKNFAIVDTGMNAMIRPPLYNAYHGVFPVDKNNEKSFVADIVGPICESTDYFAKNRSINVVKQDDLIAIADCGAYGIVLASHYNSHPIPAEVLVSSETYNVIRRKETYEDLISCEIL